MPASNTRDCFRYFIGRTVKGVLFDALPLNDVGLARGNTTIVFDNGEGLTMADNGSYWTETAETIQRAIKQRQDALNAAKAEIADVLALAGELHG